MERSRSVSTAGTAQHSPRERIVYAAAQLIRARGVAGTSLRDVVARAEAPWGSLSHYFPRGKEQLVEEAVTWASGFAAARVRRYIEATSAPTPSGLFAHMVAQWQVEFADRGFDRGCPLVATTADVAGTSEPLRRAAAEGFAQWRTAVVDGLVSMGVAAERADALAMLMLSTLEGAIVLARAGHDTAPLATVVRELGPVLDAAAAG